MGQQQGKERVGSSSSSAAASGLGLGGGTGRGLGGSGGEGASSLRASRNKPRAPKDRGILGSNIFTEHSGEYFRVSQSQSQTTERGIDGVVWGLNGNMGGSRVEILSQSFVADDTEGSRQ